MVLVIQLGMSINRMGLYPFLSLETNSLTNSLLASGWDYSPSIPRFWYTLHLPQCPTSLWSGFWIKTYTASFRLVVFLGTILISQLQCCCPAAARLTDPAGRLGGHRDDLGQIGHMTESQLLVIEFCLNIWYDGHVLNRYEHSRDSDEFGPPS